jgi:hypothetical protein
LRKVLLEEREGATKVEGKLRVIMEVLIDDVELM